MSLQPPSGRNWSLLLFVQFRLVVLLACSAALLSTLVPASITRSAGAQAVPAHAVTWDSHSLKVDGRRLVLFSGEFHYFRLPSQSQWADRLEKMKAAGLNAVSIYFDWQYHSSSPGQYDFTGVRDVDKLLSIADQLGMYVIVRVGPYMNGEVDAGGLPGWLLSKRLFPRSERRDGQNPKPDYSALYSQYSKEWYDHILPILARHQVTNGGSVVMLCVENEYPQQGGSTRYMKDLISYARADGITVPIFHNDFYFNGAWKNLVNLYAFDSYPYGFNCCRPWSDQDFRGMDTWEGTLRSKLKVKTPMFVSELQGGAFDPWGGKGYGAVAKTLNGDWLNVIDQSALAQGTTILNSYMFAGGTNWGYMSYPGVYTSYDYGAPISESGALRPAYYAAHRLGLFLQSFGPLLANASAAPSAARVRSSKVVVHTRIDPATGTSFIFLRHGDAGAAVRTQLALHTGGENLTVPQQSGTRVTVAGHGAEILLANAVLGPLHLNYSTSELLTEVTTSLGPYAVLYGPPGSSGETDFKLPPGHVSVVHNAGVAVTQENGQLRLNYRHTAEPRTVSISTANGTLRLLITDDSSASRYWVVNGMLISGPDLVTSTGDNITVSNSTSRDVRAFGASAGTSLSVDGRLTAAPDPVMGETMVGSLSGAPHLPLPHLSTWRFQPEAPEITPSFDDSGWALANHTSTTNPNVPASSGLLMDDYGFHYGFVWYRGHFTATGQETGIRLAARQSYAVFLNGRQLGEGDTDLADPPHTYARPKLFRFPPGTLRAGQNNVLAVLTESLGHDTGWLAGPFAQSPQGILSARMTGTSTPISWRIQGDAGGEQPADTERGLQNASGLYGERNGWYLPAFDDSAWPAVSTPDNWKARGMNSPIGWYRAHVQLNVPAGTSAPIGLVIPRASDKAVIWVNGWLLGRYWQQRGPQHEFYLPDGVLNSNGDNVIAIAVWNRGHAGGLTATPYLSQYQSLQAHNIFNAGVQSTGSPDYWHTSGNRILDSANRPVRIAAVNWFGMEDRFYVPAGLERRPLDSIVQRIHALGFNAIRLPFSNQLVERNPIVDKHLNANPDLKGLHALDVMDRIVAAAGRYHLRIILDDGRSEPGTQPEHNGLWYTKQYPEQAWIHDWETLVTRYLGNPTVVGVDLRNEPHTAPPGPWTVNTYLHQGATWGPYKGIDNKKTDWRLAAERGGNAVLAINPRLLILVEGLQQYPDPAQPDGIDSYWWGGVLTPARKYPVILAVPHQLVYSPHEYGPVKYPMPFFGKKMSYASMSRVWDSHWGFLEQKGYPYKAPLLIGEFGTCGTSATCVSDSKPGSQGLWFSFLMRYLKSHPQIGWSFWAVNGTSHSGDPLQNYILKSDWKSTQLPELVDTLRDVEIAPPPA